MNELGNFERHARKAMSVGSHADGGFAVPSIWLREVERFEKKFSPVRSLVRVIQVDSADVKLTANIRGTDSGWVGEAGPRTATNTSQLRQVVPSFGELYAYVSCSEWAADDVFFSMQEFLAEEVAQQFALAEGEAVIRGSGTNQPKGILDEAPTTRADFDSPYRDNEIEYINADSDSPYAVGGDGLIDLLYRVASQYRSNGTWVMNSATLAEVRKLKSTDGVYLWAPGLAPGHPSGLDAEGARVRAS
jgi:HK97 family phage major capsid protein